MRRIKAIAYKVFLWEASRSRLVRLIKPLKRKRLGNQGDPRLKEIRTFDEWLKYIQEEDPQAIDELTRLGQEPLTRGRR